MRVGWWRTAARLPLPGRGLGKGQLHVLKLGQGALAHELAYVAARYAALVPFGKVAAFLSELLPASGAQHASTVRNGGHVRHRHRAEGRRFEAIAGKVIQADGAQHRFAFARTGQASTVASLQAALAAAGVGAGTPAAWAGTRSTRPSADAAVHFPDSWTVLRRGGAREHALVALR